MALKRYRHFWGSSLQAAAPATAVAMNGDSLGDLSDGADLVSIIKSYNPPEFHRFVRQVETGYVMNERILGRLDPEATNFSIAMSSDFEIFYGYNHDYRFQIVEELHNNNNANVRYAIDTVTGTLFRREWGDYMQNGQDRDVTLHFLLKQYKRMFSRDARGMDGQWLVLDIDVPAGKFLHAGRATTFDPMTNEREIANFTIDASYPVNSPTFFGPNVGFPPPATTTEPTSPFTRVSTGTTPPNTGGGNGQPGNPGTPFG